MNNIVEETEDVADERPTTGQKVDIQIASHSSIARLTSKDETDRPPSSDLTVQDRQALDGVKSPSRPNTTGRMPSKLSHALLSRSSYVSDADYSSDSEDNEDDSQGFLITEVKHTSNDDTWRAVDESKKRSSRVRSVPDDYEDDDGYWDTDLEIEDEREEHDPTGRTQYASACQRLGIVPVSYFLRHLPDTEIVMRYHGLGPLGAKAIAKVLRSNFTMEKLNLSGNWIQAEGGAYMAKMMMENDNITYLNLSDNKLGPEGGQFIARMLMVNVTLKILDVSGNDFDDETARHFAEALEHSKTLKELSLARNRIGEEGGCLLGPMIGANDVLDNLDISWNMIRRSGAVAVAAGLKENVRLKKCDISWNGFGPEGGATVADAIAVNESLQELDVSGNRLDVDSAILIAKALHKNEQLKVLKMGNNPITTAGCVAIAAAINECDSCALTKLDLQDIPVEYEFLRLISEIKTKRDFEVIHGSVLRSGNTSSDIGKPAIDPVSNKDPLLILREHIVVNDTRIFDILKKYDVNETFSVKPEQFAAALQELGVPISDEQLTNITKKLDKNSDGNIYYGDMLNQIEAAGGTSFNKKTTDSSTTT